MGHERRPLQEMAANRLPLFPVCDRSHAAVQNVESGHKPTCQCELDSARTPDRTAAGTGIAARRCEVDPLALRRLRFAMLEHRNWVILGTCEGAAGIKAVMDA
jgi:hypothetical protein